MTHINKTTRLFSYALLFVVCFATAAFSDSFVDENAIKLLNDYQTGQTVSSMDTMDKATTDSIVGDSFIREAQIASLEDFQFGLSDYKAHSEDEETTHAKASMGASDSFVDMEALNQYEETEHWGCGINC